MLENLQAAFLAKKNHARTADLLDERRCMQMSKVSGLPNPDSSNLSYEGDKNCADFITRTFTINDAAVTLRLEAEIWLALHQVQSREGCRLDELMIAISKFTPTHLPLQNAVYLFLIDYYRAATTEAGHQMAGHGVLKH